MNKKLISRQKIIEKILPNDKNIIPLLNYNSNINKKQSEASLSFNSNKKELANFQLINFINKENFTNIKTTPITTKTSEKNSKEKNYQRKKISKNINDNKNNKNINCKLIPPKKKIIKKNKDMNNKNYLKTFIKKYSNINFDKNKKIKNKNIVDLSNSKITTTKNSGSNLSNLS